VTNSRRAAPRTLPASATATNARSWVSVTAMGARGYRRRVHGRAPRALADVVRGE
jgi:hypothetical protein